MEMRKCEKGHYYDASVHASCPYCGNVRNTEMTMAMGVPGPANMAGYSGGGNLEATVAMGVPAPGSNGLEATVAMGVPTPVPTPASVSSTDDSEKTVAIFQTETGIDPVVGWLVQMNGSHKGKDYRIHTDNNFIGRSEKMDINIQGDDSISRENQAILTYDTLAKAFYFSPSEGRSVVRVNNKATLQTIELKAYDKITLGKTELIFVPLCGEEFSWEE